MRRLEGLDLRHVVAVYFRRIDAAKWSPRDLAFRLNVSPETLRREMRNDGLNLKSLISEKRASMAADAARKGASAKKIARLCGYKHPQSANKVVSRELGGLRKARGV